MVSFVRGQFFPSDGLIDDLSSISTTSSSLSYGAERRLETPYIDEVYHAIPLIMSHLEEEEGVGDTAVASSSPRHRELPDGVGGSLLRKSMKKKRKNS